MVELNTTYMGLTLRNPVIVASSDLAKNAEGIEACEQAGAGAVVLKSIFEEQFLIEGNIPEGDMSIYPEALDYLRSGGLLEYAPNKICREIEKAKQKAAIPIIASINCKTAALWPRFARQLEEAGADALELNIYEMPIDPAVPGSRFEDDYIEIVKAVKQEIAIPVSVKLTPQVSSLANLGARLAEAGTAGLVFFNWFLEPDIKLDDLSTFSTIGKGNYRQALRWIALLADRVEADLAASGGVTDADGLVKQILAGAAAVEICSLFYRKGLDEIGTLLAGLERWMIEHRFQRIQDFRGELSFKKQELSFRDLGEAESWFRAQYLKTFK